MSHESESEYAASRPSAAGAAAAGGSAGRARFAASPGAAAAAGAAASVPGAGRFTATTAPSRGFLAAAALLAAAAAAAAARARARCRSACSLSLSVRPSTRERKPNPHQPLPRAAPRHAPCALSASKALRSAPFRSFSCFVATSLASRKCSRSLESNVPRCERIHRAVSLWSSTTSISRASAGSLTALLSKIHSFFLFSGSGATLARPRSACQSRREARRLEDAPARASHAARRPCETAAALTRVRRRRGLQSVSGARFSRRYGCESVGTGVATASCRTMRRCVPWGDPPQRRDESLSQQRARCSSGGARRP